MKPAVGVAAAALVVVACGVACSTQDPAADERSGPTCNGMPAEEVDGSTDHGTAADDVVVLVGEGAVYDGRGGDDSICLGGDIRSALVNGDAGDDYVSAAAMAGRSRDYVTEISGGPGNDTIVGSPFDDYLEGGSGDDTITAGDGADLLDGDGKDRAGRYTDPFVDGADRVEGGPGDDTISSSVGDDEQRSELDESIGGQGRDELTYGPSRVGVLLDVADGTARSRGDEEAEPETFEGFEVYQGSGEDDLVLGGPGPDHLDGGYGGDRVVGAGGDDRLALASGWLLAGPGDDVFNEVANGPWVRARMGGGDDRVTLLSGRHTVSAGPGDDSVVVDRLDGRYVVDGGPGSDALVTKGCAPGDTGTVVTCGRSTTSYTGIEIRRRRD